MSLGGQSVEELMRQIRDAEVPQAPSTTPTGTLGAAIQLEVQRRITEARTKFDAEVRAAMEEANAIQNSALVTIRAEDGEEAIFRRGEQADIKALIDWMIVNGWIPVGLPAA